MSVPFTFGEPYQFKNEHVIKIDDGKTKWVMPDYIKEELPKIYNMELRKDDIWLNGCPKTGTTWATEMIYTVYHGGTKEALSKGHFDRWCFPEMSTYQSAGLRNLPKEYVDTVEQVDYFQKAVDCPSPRFLRTHLPFSLLPPNLLDTCKVVYVTRNAKDVAVSMYSMIAGTSFDEFDEGFGAMVDYFMSEEGSFNPWWKMVHEAWEKRHHPNLFFVFYEEMKKDLRSVMRRLADFLGKFLTEEQIEELEQHLSVKKMRHNKNINMEELKPLGLMGPESMFVRKGISGDWKNYFTPETEEKWNKWWNKRMEGSDFQFPE